MEEVFEKIFRGYVAGYGARPAGPAESAADTPDGMRSYGGLMRDDIICVSASADTTSFMPDIKSPAAILTAALQAAKARVVVLSAPQEGNVLIFAAAPDYPISAGGRFAACGAPVRILKGRTFIPLRVSEHKAKVLYDGTDDQPIESLPPELMPVDADPGVFQADGREPYVIKKLLTYRDYLVTSRHAQKFDWERIFEAIDRWTLAVPVSDDDKKRLLDMSNFTFVPDFTGPTGRFSHSTCADYMIKKYHACMVDGALYLYDGYIYRSDFRAVMQEIDRAYPDGTDKQRQEVYKIMQLRAPERKRADPALVAFKNGFLDLREPASCRHLKPFSPDHCILHQLAVDYHPVADTDEAKKADDFLSGVLDSLSCGDAGIKKLLIACAAYCLYASNPLRSFFVLVGEKRSGKSTFLTMIEAMLGEAECAKLTLPQLLARFGPANLAGKLAELGDEIPDAALSATDVNFIKGWTGAYSPVSAELKGRDFFDFMPTAKLIFSCNSIPRMHDPDGSCLSRLIPIPMLQYYDPESADTELPSTLKSKAVGEAFARLCVRMLDEMHITSDHAHFPTSPLVDRMKAEYSKDSDSLQTYLTSLALEAGDFIGRTVHECYMEYSTYCKEAGMHGYLESTFRKQLFRRFHLTTRQQRVAGGKRMQVIVSDPIAASVAQASNL